MPKWDAARLIKALTNAGDGKRGMDRMLHEVNADIDALTAERDELKRRLDAVVAMLEEDAGNEPVSYTYPEDPSLLRWQTVSELHARALAIAEGREV